MPVEALALILHINENFFLQRTQFACTTSLEREKQRPKSQLITLLKALNSTQVYNTKLHRCQRLQKNGSGGKQLLHRLEDRTLGHEEAREGL